MAKGFKQQKRAIKNTLKANKGKTVHISNVPTWKSSRKTGRYTEKTGQTRNVRASSPTKKVKAARGVAAGAGIYGGLKVMSGGAHVATGNPFAAKVGAKKMVVGAALAYGGHKVAQRAQRKHTSNMRNQEQVHVSYGSIANTRNAKTGVRTSNPQKIRSRGRVGKR